MQKCVRAGGKHNDLDAIGRSLRHLSFFEMLGNFSFGDYFKAEAIPWAWEFVTEVLGLDGDRIWVTVHTSDDEAEEIWADAVGFPRERIQRLDKDNFWEMGDTGPCGPSARSSSGTSAPTSAPTAVPANPAAEDRYVEFWNLVFPQYFRGADGELTDLPPKPTSTPAPASSASSACSPAATACTPPTRSRCSPTGPRRSPARRFGGDRLADVALRLLADHTRTVAFLVADGVMPSNEDRGYVLRRVLRRAVHFSYLLGVEKPVLPPMIETCVEVMGDAYPELAAHADHVLTIVSREEERFRRTLRTGASMLDDAHRHPSRRWRASTARSPSPLHDTYGFPFEVTQEIAAERGYEVDESGFEAAMAEQQARAKAAAKGGGVAVGDEADAFRAVLDEHGPTEFVGREHDSATTHGGRRRPGRRRPRRHRVDLPRRTPFYAEAGGQVGDTGTIIGPERHAPRCSTPSTPCPACTATSPGSPRAASTWATRSPRRSTSSAGPPSAATTPAPTSCTGRCARCWATT